MSQTRDMLPAQPVQPLSQAAIRHASRWSSIFWGAVIILLAFICYYPALRGEFIWDDLIMIPQNPLVLAKDGLRDIWFTTKPVDYFPVTYSFCWIEWRLWGENTIGYHIFNVLLHALSAILIWRILIRLKLPGAWLAAAIFAVHPVAVESVAWIAELKNTLCLLFSAAAVLLYLQYDDDHRRSRYYLSIVAFLLALLSKTAVVFVPVILLLLHYLLRRQISRKNLGETSPFFAASFALGLATIWFQFHRASGGQAVNQSGMAARIVIAGKALLFYVEKTLAPINLAFIYPRWNVESHALVSYVPLLFFVIVAWGLWLLRSKVGLGSLIAFACFVLLLLPVLGFASMYYHTYSFVADHFEYFALPVLIALVVSGGVLLFQRFRISGVVLKLSGCAVLVTCSLLTYQHAYLFKDHRLLFRDTIAKNPTCAPALVNLGAELALFGNTDEALAMFANAPESYEAQFDWANTLVKVGKLDAAIPHYERSIQLDPGFAPAHTELGLLLEKKGEKQQALQEYLKAAQADPADEIAQNNASSLLLESGEAVQALNHSLAAIKLDKQVPQAYYNAANALVFLGKTNEAALFYSKAIKLKPDFADARYNYGFLLAKAGKYLEAQEQYAATTNIKPNYINAYYNWGDLLLKNDDLAGAEAKFKKTIELDPSVVEAHYQLGVICSRQKRYAEAAQHWQQAVRLKPSWTTALNNLSWLLSTAPDDSVRNGAQALKYARTLESFSAPDDPDLFDTAAAAYAETGQFSEAVAFEKKAIALAQKNSQANSALEEHLRSYLSNRPWRE